MRWFRWDFGIDGYFLRNRKLRNNNNTQSICKQLARRERKPGRNQKSVRVEREKKRSVYTNPPSGAAATDVAINKVNTLWNARRENSVEFSVFFFLLKVSISVSDGREFFFSFEDRGRGKMRDVSSWMGYIFMYDINAHQYHKYVYESLIIQITIGTFQLKTRQSLTLTKSLNHCFSFGKFSTADRVFFPAK